jgi:spermidine/putrescine transport system substrate-binding protein
MPYNWGTTGLLVRSDLLGRPVTSWSDLWDERYAGKIALRALPKELVSIALRAMGYPLSSEKPEELDATLAHLLQLKNRKPLPPAVPR